MSVRRLLSTSICLAAFLPASRATRSSNPNPKMAIWQAPSVLRGANVDVSPREQPTPEALLALHSLGANLVVLSAYGIQHTEPPFADDAEATFRLAAAVSAAEQAGLWVVIAFRTGPGLTDIAIEAQTPGLQSKLWVDGTARHAFNQMWRRVATQFAHDPRIIGYDLIVEPFPEAAIEHLNPCCSRSSDSALSQAGINWPAIADTMVTAIRSVDSLTPILIGATGFALPPFFASLKAVTGAYIVYDVHQYEPHTYTFQGNRGYPVGLGWPGGSFQYWRTKTLDTLNAAWLRRLVQPVISFQQSVRAPVVVGEFGVSWLAPGAPGFIRAETALFDSLGWHGAMWAWDCCGNMRVSPDDSLAADSTKRRLLETYRDYWARNAVDGAPKR